MFICLLLVSLLDLFISALVQAVSYLYIFAYHRHTIIFFFFFYDAPVVPTFFSARCQEVRQTDRQIGKTMPDKFSINKPLAQERH